jgi:hypothetical protein
MATELEQIQEVMRTDRNAYFRDQAMQDRYAELLAAENPEAAEVGGEGPELLPVEEARSGLIARGGELADLAEEWSQMHSFPELLRNTQNAVLSIVGEFSEREQRAFMARFDELPAKAVASIYNELAMGKPNYIPEASEEAVAAFSETPEGAELVREWGYGAARRVGIVKARWARAASAMGASAYASVKSWFNGLETNQAKAVLRELGR